MLEGRDAYMSVDGHKCMMTPGDLVLAPSMAWHEHGNDGPEPVIWLDGLDAPLVRYLDIQKMEPRGGVGRRQAARRGGAADDPLAKWDDAYDRLLRQAETAASPFDDVIVEYHDPVNGESVLPTIGCYLQMIRAGVETHAHARRARRSITSCAAAARRRSARRALRLGRRRFLLSCRRTFRTRTASAAMSPRFCSRCRTCRCSKRSASTWESAVAPS